MTRRPLDLRLGLMLALALLLAAPALAAVPQTISIDGVNDFNPANLVDDDTGDTEIKNWCTSDPEVEGPMDIGQVFVTNDASNVYIGFEYDRDCFSSPQVNLGIAFSVGAEGDGGNTDPFNRKIAWNTIVRKPDNVFYVVIDGFNYEALYDWTGSAWANISATVNPSYGSGSNGLGMANDLGFEELALPLSVFGVSAGQTLYLEIWMTQDGTTKPPLDCMMSDGVQTSTPTGTTFDVATAVEMTTWFPYVVQSTVDVDPPLVTGASHTVSAQIDVTFNEPVDPTTAQLAGNYGLSGGTTAATITAATVDGVAPNLVHLTLSNDIIASADAYTVTVQNVEDLAGNPIVANGVGNVGCFAVKQVKFEGLFGPYLATNSSPPDGFTVEGSKYPLSFDVCDGADMVDTGVDDIWAFTTDFSFPLNCADQSGSLIVEWKFNHNCGTWESIGNRSFTLTLASPSVQTISKYWNDLDPTAFTDKDIDVIFTVDMTRQAPGMLDEVAIGGSVLPLTFSSPFTPLVDDGTGQDAAAGDMIYTTVVRFPSGSLKTVEYKFLLNEAYECLVTGNRGLWLNDAMFDIIGGPNGPLVMPAAYYDRCYVIGRDVEVVFSVDTNNSGQTVNPYEPPVVQLTGSQAPLSFDVGKVAPYMLDNGVAPDATAGDGIFTLAVVFPDSTNWGLEYKYFVNGEYEGQALPNRFVWLNDAFDAAGNPQVLPTDVLNFTVPTGIGDQPVRKSVAAELLYTQPNPFNPSTTVFFETHVGGRVRLDVFDARGRHVRTLADKDFEAGTHGVPWDGRADDGRAVSSGVYFTRLLSQGSADGLKMVLLK